MNDFAILASLFVGIGAWVAAARNRKLKKRGFLWLLAILALFVSFALSAASSTTSSPTVAQATDAPATDAPADSPATDAPDADTTTDAPTVPVDAPMSKSAMLSAVNSAVTPGKVAGNPAKYVGDYVKWDCTIANVVTDGGTKFANALCDDANIVLVGDRVGELDAQQELVVIGDVTDPMEGTNAMGGSLHFPTVTFRYNI